MEQKLYTKHILNQLEKETIAYNIKTDVLSILMIGTDCFELFTKNDYKKFLMRLFVFFSKKANPENFFNNGTLFYFYYKKRYYDFTLNDLENYIGVSFYENPVKKNNFKEWYDKINKSIENCVLISVILNIELFEHYHKKKKNKIFTNEITENPTLFISTLKEMQINCDKFESSENLIEVADKISDFLITQIDDSLFEKWMNLNSEFFLKYINYKEIQPTYYFNYEALSEEVKNKIKKHFLEFFNEEDSKTEEKKIMLLTEIAWYNANGFIYFHSDNYGYYKYVDSMYHFNETQPELMHPDGFFSLDDLIEEYFLEDLRDDLKVVD